MRTQNILEKQIEEGLIKKAVDFAQGVGDVVSGVASLIPGGNLVGSAIDAVSAGVDTLQGDKGDAAFRAASAVGGLIPGVGAAMKAGKLAKAGVAAGRALSKSGKVLGGKTGATLRRAGAGARKKKNQKRRFWKRRPSNAASESSSFFEPHRPETDKSGPQRPVQSAKFPGTFGTPAH